MARKNSTTGNEPEVQIGFKRIANGVLILVTDSSDKITPYAYQMGSQVTFGDTIGAIVQPYLTEKAVTKRPVTKRRARKPKDVPAEPAAPTPGAPAGPGGDLFTAPVTKRRGRKKIVTRVAPTGTEG